jgi:hypothetical protein
LRLLGLAVFLAAACDPVAPPGAKTGATGSQATASVPSITFEAKKRIVAFGDVHGDLDATLRALRLAGATDEAGAWIGVDLFVVQVGDQLDRGDDDRAILDLFKKLEGEAKDKGSAFVAVNGNHEIMQAQLDFRYVTPGAFPPFDEFAASAPPFVASLLPRAQRGRAAAFLPGGPYAKLLAERPLVAIVGDSVFVHGGVLKKHVDYGLEKMDGEVRAWLRGERRDPPRIAVADDGPLWSRMYSTAAGEEECAELDRVLGALGKKRMVMGHTPQKPGATAACGGKAWRIDTGMAKHYGGPVEVLEIVGDEVKVLKEQK